ncbi:hypothetical protein D3C80_1613530 [compost metagenome]
MRRHATGLGAEDRRVGHLGLRLELLQVADEAAQLLHPTIPGLRRTKPPFAGSHPIGHQLDGQRAVVVPIGDELRKVGQERVVGVQLEPQPTALSQIVGDSCL